MRRGRFRPHAVIAAAIALAAGLGLVTGTAAAATEKRTVAGEMVFIDGNRADRPGNCSALGFLRWADVPGTAPGTGRYTFRGQPATVALRPPYDDTGAWVIPYAVEPGYHWVLVSKSWRDGPGASDRSDMRARAEPLYAGPASVEVTVDVPKSRTRACTTAKAGAAKTRKGVANAAPPSRRPPGRRKAKARAALKRANAKHKDATAKVRRACT